MSACLTEERRQAILERLRRDGKVVAAELSSSLAVSPDTVRRDLRELAEAGLLRRVHGGALPAAVGAQPYAVRREQAPAAKAAIARATSRLLRRGQVILLDSGTTTLEVARHLPPELEATVITNSPPIAVALAEHPTVEVAVLGGDAREGRARARRRRDDRGAPRPCARTCSCSASAASIPRSGSPSRELEESYVKRAMIANAAEVVAVSSADKLGSAAPYVVAPLEELTHLVTEDSAPPEQLAAYRALGIEVVLA